MHSDNYIEANSMQTPPSITKKNNEIVEFNINN